MKNRKLWIAFGLVVVASFAVLGTMGVQMVRNAPPIPQQVVTAGGRVLLDHYTIQEGQGVWQSLGGQQIGSIWGHGAYVAPDWSADYLHRESVFLLDRYAQATGAENFAALTPEQQSGLQVRLKREMRTNSYDPASGTLAISEDRAAAFELLSAHYADVFAAGRPEYAIPRGALVDTVKQRQMAAFFFWTSWAASTERPGDSVTYTNNWPHEPLVGNLPTGSIVMWSLLSVVLLIGATGALLWYTAANTEPVSDFAIPRRDPLLGMSPSPSQRAVMNYFYVVTALILVQVVMGVIAAHYSVEDGFYGFNLSAYLPYSIARTWHIQLGLFWIATSWLATGLFVAPAVSGFEPKRQKLGVNILLGALFLVVGGSLTGEWLGIKQMLGNAWFWFGAQGYEYVDLGRFWQIALFGGMVFWLWLMFRALKPALIQKSESRSMLMMFAIASIAIPLFYAAGLMYGQRSHLVTAEYWRWWVVHLWVEGFFEVFATVVIAFLFTRLKLIGIASATRAVLFSTCIFLTGGIIGTLHHLYFTGTTTAVVALGAMFSALEIVPLSLVGFEAYHNLKTARGAEPGRKWIRQYRWPIYFFVAVSFWNLVGAGVFGFLINPPIALYYMQGLNLTPVHGHTALFGVYGMLGMGLMLFCFRAFRPEVIWKERSLAVAFWCLNLGLVLMVVLSMLPIGLMQAWASIDVGTWYARSSDFLQQPHLQRLRWLRGIGDGVFTLGTLALAWFVIGLATGRSYTTPSVAERLATSRDEERELVEVGD